MLSLPPALAAWAEPLSIFPRDLALSLGPCVQRLAQALGPMRRDVREATREPNGYGGLSRRGPYERLLISEWLLADEVPEEFLRRAAQHEHAFLSLSFQQPTGARRSVALFDAGPDVLGGPRVGQVAALIVLAARAERAGARFAWGVLQDGERRLTEEVTPASVIRLLFARTARRAGEEDARAWAVASGVPIAADDAWVIGTPRSPGLGAATGRLELEDVLETGRRALAVTVRRRGQAPRTAELSLPAQDACVRLVRDPFSARRAPASTALGSPADGICFSQNGRRILVRHRAGGFSAHPVPNSPRAQPGHSKGFQPRAGHTLVAAGWSGTGCVALTRSAEGFHLHAGPRSRMAPVFRLAEGAGGLTASVAPGPLSPLLRVFPIRLHVPAIAVEMSYLFADAAGHLFELAPLGEHLVVRVQKEVLDFRAHEERLHVLASHRGDDGDHVAHWEGDAPSPWSVEALRGLRALFGWDLRSPVFWMAVERMPGVWEVRGGGRAGRGPFLLAPPSGTFVFGVGRWRQDPDEPALLLLEEDRRTVSVVSRQGSFSLPSVAEPVTCAVANGHGPEVALLAEDGSVTVLSLTYAQKVLELRPAARQDLPAGEGA
jgi:hypothetical protein